MPRESTIQIFRSGVASNVPSGLTSGELAVNMVDRRFFVGGTNGSNITFLDASAVVTGVNGVTGAITNVAVTNATNNFTAIQSFPNGISGQSIRIGSGATFGSNIDLSSSTAQINGYNAAGYLKLESFGTLFSVQAEPTIVLQDGDTDVGGNGTITINPSSGSGGGTVNIGNVSVATINLQGNSVNTGKMSVVAGLSAQSFLVSAGSTFSGRASFTVGLTTQSLNVAQGATFNSTATFFGNISAPNIVGSVNGVTGAITITGDGGAVRGSGNNIIAARLASTSLTGVAYYDSTNFTVAADGKVSLASSGLSWSVITADQTAAINNGYLTNKGTLLTLTLPTTAAVGSVIRVSGMNAGLWKIAQNASQVIHFGKTDTTTGTGGYLQATQTRDSVELVCCVANNEWNVLSSVGNIDFA